MSTWWLMPRGPQRDRRIVSAEVSSPLRGAALVDRWEGLARQCAASEPALAEHSATVADALRARFEVPEPALPPFPAFRNRAGG